MQFSAANVRRKERLPTTQWSQRPSLKGKTTGMYKLLSKWMKKNRKVKKYYSKITVSYFNGHKNNYKVILSSINC